MPIIGDHIQPTKDQRQQLKWYLRMALANYESWDRLTINERHEYDKTGLKLRDRFVTYLEVLLAFSKLPWIEKISIFQNLRMGHSQEYISERLGVTPRSVRRYVQQGYNRMIYMIWDEEELS